MTSWLSREAVFLTDVTHIWFFLCMCEQKNPVINSYFQDAIFFRDVHACSPRLSPTHNLWRIFKFTLQISQSFTTPMSFKGLKCKTVIWINKWKAADTKKNPEIYRVHLMCSKIKQADLGLFIQNLSSSVKQFSIVKHFKWECDQCWHLLYDLGSSPYFWILQLFKFLEI